MLRPSVNEVVVVTTHICGCNKTTHERKVLTSYEIMLSNKTVCDMLNVHF